MPATTRLGLPYPAGTDPADVPADLGALAGALDGAALDDQGLLANRPVSTPGSPGIRGRYYYATDTGLVYRDHGAGWTPLNPAHQVKDMTKVRRNAAATITSGLVTGIEFTTLVRSAGTAFGWTAGSSTGYRIDVLEAGLYLMVGQLRWASAAGGRRFAQITNGAGTEAYGADEQPGSAVTATQHNVTAVEYLPAGAEVSLSAFQDSGANIQATVSGTYAPALTLVKLGL